MKTLSKIPGMVLALTAVAAVAQQPPASSPRSGHQTLIRGNSGDVTWNSGAYQYDPMGNITAIGPQAYTYDVNGRLVEAHVFGPEGGSTQSFAYDAFGNMISTTKDTVATSIAIDSATNRLANAAYDAAGNVTTFQPPGSTNTYTYSYDPLNMVRMVSDNVGGTSGVRALYVYTADDERIWSYATPPSNVSHWKIRDLGKKVLRDFTDSGGSTILAKDYFYRDGTLLAAVTPAFGGQSSSEEHFSVDHLGTPRLVTNASHDKVGFHTYYPFGQEWMSAGNDTEVMKFTGHERDSSGTGNDVDYMHARYYLANVGRFLSVDPVINQKRALTNPQAWNRYSYVENNPLNRTDPDGKCSRPTSGRDEVGVCIEGFIASKRVGLMGVGHGDNRTFAANDPSKTNRVQVQIVINTKTGKIAATTRAAESTAGVGPVVLRGQGTANTTISGATRGADGTISFTSQTTAVNGLAGKPGAPKDSIDFKFNIAVSPSGTVGLMPGGRTDGYPSIGAYSYTSQGTSTLYERREGDIDDLAAPMEVSVPPR